VEWCGVDLHLGPSRISWEPFLKIMYKYCRDEEV